MRDGLRLELLKRFRSQVGAAQVLGINEPRLSRILRGWVKPTDEETKKFKKLLGARKFSRLLRQKDNDHIHGIAVDHAAA